MARTSIGSNPFGASIDTDEITNGAVTPVKLADNATFMVPAPIQYSTIDAGAIAASTNTTMTVGSVYVPFGITVNKISIKAVVVGGAGTLDIGVYSEDGQTKEIDVTTASISGAGVVTTAVSAVQILSGIHYIAVVPNGSANVTLLSWETSDNSYQEVSSEITIEGTETVSAGALPATFDPTAITAADSSTLYCRFDT